MSEAPVFRDAVRKEIKETINSSGYIRDKNNLVVESDVLSYPWSCMCCWRRESLMPTASKALQALVHNVIANPVTLKLSDDSNTKLLIPSLQL